MKRLAVSMIVRNETELILKCLESVKEANEFVIVDTGSEDDTCDKVKDFLKGKNGKLYHFKWIDDFAAARNFAQSKVKSDFVLIIDADEVLVSGMDKLKRAIQKPVNCIEVTVNTKEEIIMQSPRVFLSSIKWVDAIHNRIDYNGKSVKMPDVLIKGVISPAHSLDPDRTLRILRKELTKNPNNLRYIYYYGREFLKRREFERMIFWFEKYIRQNTDYTNETGEVYFLLGHAYSQLSQHIKAIDCLFNAIKINPDHRDAWAEVARITTDLYKAKIKKFMNVADNSQVLFDRNLYKELKKLQK